MAAFDGKITYTMKTLRPFVVCRCRNRDCW